MQKQSIRNGAIGVEYTSKALSGWGGLSLMFEYLDRIGFSERLRGAVREMKRSNNRVENCDVVLTFLATVLVGGNRFAHVQRVLHGTMPAGAGGTVYVELPAPPCGEVPALLHTTWSPRFVSVSTSWCVVPLPGMSCASTCRTSPP